MRPIEISKIDKASNRAARMFKIKAERAEVEMLGVVARVRAVPQEAVAPVMPGAVAAVKAAVVAAATR
jgi:hypothetical protein